MPDPDIEQDAQGWSDEMKRKLYALYKASPAGAFGDAVAKIAISGRDLVDGSGKVPVTPPGSPMAQDLVRPSQTGSADQMLQGGSAPSDVAGALEGQQQDIPLPAAGAPQMLPGNSPQIIAENVRTLVRGGLAQDKAIMLATQQAKSGAAPMGR